jgi:hypothetical protein
MRYRAIAVAIESRRREYDREIFLMLRRNSNGGPKGLRR